MISRRRSAARERGFNEHVSAVSRWLLKKKSNEANQDRLSKEKRDSNTAESRLDNNSDNGSNTHESRKLMSRSRLNAPSKVEEALKGHSSKEHYKLTLDAVEDNYLNEEDNQSIDNGSDDSSHFKGLSHNRSVKLELDDDDVSQDWLVLEKLQELERCVATSVKHPPKYSKNRLYLFLRVRDYDVKRAVKLVDGYTKFYRKYGCEDQHGVPGYKLLNVAKVQTTLATNVLSLPGTQDKQGNALLVMRPRYFTPEKQEILNNLLLCAMYLVEQLLQQQAAAATSGTGPAAGDRPVTLLADMTSWTRKNFSILYARKWFGMMQTAWPVKIGSLLFVDTPTWFEDIWRIIRPMMKKSFASKVKFVSRENLKYFVDNDNLPKNLGGQAFDNIHRYIEERQRIEEEVGVNGITPGSKLSGNITEVDKILESGHEVNIEMSNNNTSDGNLNMSNAKMSGTKKSSAGFTGNLKMSSVIAGKPRRSQVNAQTRKTSNVTFNDTKWNSHGGDINDSVATLNSTGVKPITLEDVMLLDDNTSGNENVLETIPEGDDEEDGW